MRAGPRPPGPAAVRISSRCLSVSFPSAPVGSAHRYVLAFPGGGVTSASARAGVEQYSSAIHSARSTRSLGSESSRVPVGVDEFLVGDIGGLREACHDAFELLVAERDLDDRPDLDVVVDPVVERAGQTAGGGERFDSRDQGFVEPDTRFGGAGPGELRQMREAESLSRSARVGGAAPNRGVSALELPVRQLMYDTPALTVPHPDQRRADAVPAAAPSSAAVTMSRRQ